MSDVLVAAPLRVEAALISSASRGALVHKTGMGPAKARAAAGELGARAAQAMLVLGFCGGLDEGSVPGEVIVAEEVYAAPDEGPCRAADPLRARRPARDAADRAGAEGARRAASSASRSSRSASAEPSCTRGGAIAVDMESVWLAAGAGERPFGVVRVVLDSPSHELMRPQAVGGALRAALALRKVAAALHDWAPGD